MMVIKYVMGCGRERERETQNDSCSVWRGRYEELKKVSNGLKWVACLPLTAMVISGFGLQPRSMSVTMTLWQLESVLMLVTLLPLVTEKKELCNFGYNTRENLPCLLPQERGGYATHLGSMTELTLLAGHKWAGPVGVRVTKLVLPPSSDMWQYG